MRIFKKTKIFIAGAFFGLAVSFAGGVFANQSYLMAALVDSIRYNIDGIEHNYPAETRAFIYEDVLYAPVGYVAEKLGAKFEYDKNKKIVNLTTVNKETPQSLPLTQVTKNGVVVTLNNVTVGPNGAFFNLKLYNSSEGAVRIEAYNSVAVINDKEYKAGYAESSMMSWINDINEDDEVDGFLEFKNIPSDAESMILHLKVKNNYGTYETFDLQYNVQLSKK